MTEMNREDLDRFRGLMEQHLGLYFDDGKLDELQQVLDQRVRESRCGSPASYVRRLESPLARHEELRALADTLTVQETYFFRYPDQFRALADIALPHRERARQDSRQLRLLSAGCSSGEEPYTMAILLRERLPELASWHIDLRGVDVSREALRKGRFAHYSAWSLRETPRHAQERWFMKHGHDFVLDPQVRGMVTFEELNLIESDPGFWRPDYFDIIFCRNVIIYLSPESIRLLVERLTRSLAPGGFLFLGHAETLRGLSREFHLLHTHDTFYYLRRDEIEPTDGMQAFPRGLETPRRESSVSEMPDDSSMVESIGAADERAGSRPASLPATVASARLEAPEGNAALGADQGILRAMELFRQERFDETVELLRSIPSSSTDPDLLLLLAAVLTNRGEGPEAERICRQVLSLDELNAGAHFLLALCRQQAGDATATHLHAKTAVYLDPTFAMAHLHLGRLARLSGDLQAARNELGRALDLLGREDSSRILIFGGGFHRHALTQLCRAELQACGSPQ